MDRLRSLLFAVLFYGVTAILVVVAVAAAMFGREPLTRVTLAWAHFHRWCARAILGIQSHIEGRVPDRPVLIAAKHQSMYETLELVVMLGRPAVVLKQELSDIPGWGWVARRYGVIPVDRRGGASALRRMLDAARESVAEGRLLLIFPEGTRVAPGEQPKLQSGFAGLYKMLALPVVPVALDSGKVWPRRGPKRPGVVTFRFGEEIAPGLPRHEIEARVHTGINALEE